jgi:hypothetical protein
LAVSNTSDQALTISLRLAAPGTPYCLEPRSLAFMPTSHVGRRFREPERRAVIAVAFDQASCSIRGTVPPTTALELDFHPVAWSHFLENAADAELTLEGSAGALTLKGPQVRRHFAERSGVLVFEYGAA